MSIISFITCSCEVSGHQSLDFHNASDIEIIVFDDLIYSSSDKPEKDYQISADTYERIKNKKRGIYILPGDTNRIIDLIGISLEGHLFDRNYWLFIVLNSEIVAQSTAEELTDGRAILDTIYYYYEDISLIGPVLTYPNDYGHLPD